MTISKEAMEAALSAYQCGDLDWDSQDEHLMRLALEAALPFLPIAVEGKAPEGWQLVPKVPTEEMMEKGRWGGISPLDEQRRANMAGIWKAMLAAAPSSPGKDGGQEVEAVGCPGDKCEYFWEEAPCCNGWRPQPASTALVERLTSALSKAEAVLSIYADPTGYADADGNQLEADAEEHEGLLAPSAPDGWQEAKITPHQFAQEYEFRGDTDYTPTDGERTMIEDAICGYLAAIEEDSTAISEPNANAGLVGRLRNWRNLSKIEAGAAMIEAADALEVRV